MKRKTRTILFLAAGLLLLAGLIAPLTAAHEAGWLSTAAGPHLGKEFALSASDNVKHLPSVAYNWQHKEYLVVWHSDWPGGNEICAERVSSAGVPLGVMSISYGTNDRGQAAAAYDSVNDRYLIVWTYDINGDGSNWDVYGRFVPWDGPSGSLTEFVICNWSSSQWNPKVAYALAQGEFLVVWANTSSGVPAYISGRRVYANGSGFPAGGFTIASHGTLNRINPDVAYNLARNEYLVVWEAVNANNDIYGVRLTGSGVVLGGGEFGIAGWPDNEERPAAAACNIADQYLVAWQSYHTATNYDIYARYVSGDGVPGSVHLIDSTTGPEENADVACNMSGLQYMIVWQSLYVSSKYGVIGRLMSTNGPLGAGFEIAPASWTGGRTYAAVAGGHTNYLAAWERERDGTSYQDIYGRLVTPYALFLPLVLKNN